MSTIKNLKETMRVNSLLSAENANPKVAKNAKENIFGTVLHLAPADLSGYEVCPMRSEGCTAACLHSSGNPAYFENKQKSRVARTKAYFEHRHEFMNLLAIETSNHIAKAKQKKMKPSIRLNGTSDIPFERVKFKLEDWVAERIGRKGSTIFEIFNDVQFMDYTKRHNRNNLPSNYYLTFSLNEVNQEHAKSMLDKGINVAVVFSGKLPTEFMDHPVIDGDAHDARFLDPSPCIVGLKVKGKGRQDDSGFVVQL